MNRKITAKPEVSKPASSPRIKDSGLLSPEGNVDTSSPGPGPGNSTEEGQGRAQEPRLGRNSLWTHKAAAHITHRTQGRVPDPHKPTLKKEGRRTTPPGVDP